MKGYYLPKIYIFNIILFLLVAGYVNAQITIKGTVKEESSGNFLPGASVVIKGTETGTITDANGNYTLQVEDPNTELIFSFMGYLTETVAINGQQEINISLVDDYYSLEKVVVIGYGTQKKSDLTGAVTVVNAENLEKIVTNDISKVLQGQAAGVQIHGSGEPGAIPVVTIRGTGSFQNSDPLYVVDGVPISPAFNINGGKYNPLIKSGGISDFNPSDIESIQVLKDASACAIYGARGANGVIIITTKKGKAGEMSISYEGNYGWQNIVKRMDVTNRVQFQEMNNMARANDRGFPHPANNPNRDEYIDSIDTDWQKEVFRTGHITNHILTIKGGNDNSTYRATLDYFDHKGTMVGPAPHLTRYSISISADQKRGKMKFGQSFLYSYSDQKRLSNSQWAPSLYETVIGIPTIAVYDSNNIGGFGGGIDGIHDQIGGNQVGFNYLKNNTLKRNRLFAVVYGEYEIIKSMSYKVNLSYDRSDWFIHEFIPIFNIGSRHTNPIAFLNEWRGENPQILMEHTLTFNKSLNKHNITLLGGYTVQYDYWQDEYAHAEGYTEPYFEVLSAGTQNQAALGTKKEHSMISYIGRLNYSYADKYLLTGTIRRDYSSRFGPNNKYGDFPAMSLAWKINNEGFFNFDFVSLFKLRASYGVLGNEKIDDYSYETFVNNAATYVFNGTLPSAATQTQLADPSLKWEEQVSKNIGLDLALFHNKFEFTAEYFHNNPRDLLLRLSVPWSTGKVDDPYTNGASMINKGFEFVATYRKAEGEFHYEISANLTTLKNEVTKLGKNNDPNVNFMSKTQVGSSMGELYGWEFEGIFQNDSAIDDHAFQSANTRPGDCMFKDNNGRDADGNLTGEPDGIINDDDKIYLGSAIPKLTGGINLSISYKGFDLSIFFNGVYGNKIWNGIYATLNNGQEGNYSKELYENYWRGEGTSNTHPRLTIRDANQNNRMSQRWVQSGSYLRLQNIQLGYNLPDKVIKRIKGASSMRIYISSQNLFTITKYKGFDPDIANDGYFYRGQDYGSYPSPRTYMLGIKITL